MWKRFAPRLSFANVISVIALFIALGGGYAVAFSGSGTLQKGALTNIPATITTVRSLTGIGAIKVACTGPGDMGVYMSNTSGEGLEVYREVAEVSGSPTSAHDDIPNGSTQDFLYSVTADTHSVADLHVAPNDGSKAPQADIQVGATAGGASCVPGRVTVLALNTQQ